MAPADPPEDAVTGPMGPVDLFAVGRLERDLVVALPEPPARDQKASGEFLGWLGGGPAANVACNAAALGARPSMLGDVGEDDTGAALRADLLASGVQTEAVQTRSAHVTPVCLVMVHPDHTRTILAMHGETVAEVDRTAIDRVRLSDARLVHVSVSRETDAVAFASAAADAGCRTIIDVEGCTRSDGKPHLAGLLEHAAVAIVTEPLLAAADLSADPTAIATLAAAHDCEVVATLGSRGALVAEPGQTAIPVPTAPAQPVDTTGAGDAFAAGLMVGLLRQRTLSAAARIGAAAAAVTTEHLGAWGALTALRADVRVQRAMTTEEGEEL